MKFVCHVDIHASRDQVIENFDSMENLSRWQDGFVSYKHLSGEPKALGSTTELVYKIGKRDMVMVETVLVKDYPKLYAGRYDYKEGSNTMKNTFQELSESTTRWNAVIEYTEINSMMMKVMSKLFPGMFKKQAHKWMKQFKEMVEIDNAKMK